MLEEADDPDVRRAELIADYRERFANPWSAAERGYVDDVIEPRRTRPVLINALETIQSTTFGGFHVNFGPRVHTGSKFVELTMIDESGRVRR